MEPRLKTSKKWTTFPTELQEQIIEVLEETFEDKAKVGRFHLEGRIYQKELLLRLGYLENGRLAQANAEVSIEYDFEGDNMQALIGLAVDCAGGLLNSHFENPNEDLPRTWKSFEMDKREVFMQFSTLNSELEEEADKLLGIDSQADLVQGEDQEIEAEAIKKMLGVDDSDEDPETH